MTKDYRCEEGHLQGSIPGWEAEKPPTYIRKATWCQIAISGFCIFDKFKSGLNADVSSNAFCRWMVCLLRGDNWGFPKEEVKIYCHQTRIWARRRSHLSHSNFSRFTLWIVWYVFDLTPQGHLQYRCMPPLACRQKREGEIPPVSSWT
jgi:hypothetical protein